MIRGGGGGASGTSSGCRARGASGSGAGASGRRALGELDTGAVVCAATVAGGTHPPVAGGVAWPASMPTTSFRRSNPVVGGGGGGGGGGGCGCGVGSGAFSATRSPLHSRKLPQELQNWSRSSLRLPHFLQMITGASRGRL